MEKNVLVTGISRGIGREIAEVFLENGYTLYGTYFNSKDNANSLVDNYGDSKVHLLGGYDFTKTEDVRNLVSVLSSFRFDSVVCNSGIFPYGHDFEDFDLERFNETMNCNFYSQLILTVGLRNNINNYGSIVLISSIDALSDSYGSMAYSISKAAVVSLAKCLCVNFGNRGIRVNTVLPGPTNTDMNTPQQMDIAPYFTPSNRVAIPSDIAQVVYFLSTNSSSFVNGANLVVDGGLSVESILLKSEHDPLLSSYLRFTAKNNDNLTYNWADDSIDMNGKQLLPKNSH